jgi:sugar phosphate isomerase/epimerase
VQLRQARRGEVQVHPDELGDVDFPAVLARLEALGYGGRLSVEYFDLPEYGWPLEDPVGHAVALASIVRPLLR